MTGSEIYREAREKARTKTCPDCGSSYALEYADDEVLVCRFCKYSIEAEDLASEWQDILEEEYDFYKTNWEEE